MPRHDVCSLEDLPTGRSRAFQVAGTSLVAARSGTAVFVLENRCSHDDGEFEDARVLPAEAGGEIECPRHGARFDLATGRATRMPAVAPIECFTAGVSDGRVWVDLPEN